ncbi:MAG TPA: hypothetical protein VGB26_07905 [Nitrospiria bacterium]|jgi:hypothetical protein
MSSIYKSGAFAQQCFSAHRETLFFRKIGPPAEVIMDCSSCEMEHRLSVLQFSSTLPQAIENAFEHLTNCITGHSSSLRVSAMDVVRDHVGARCTQCNRSFDLEIGAIETLR